MSRFNVGDASVTFSGDDAPFQKTSREVEARMAAAAENMRKAAAKIDLSLAQNKLSFGGLETEIEKSMAKASANMRREASAIERSLKSLGTTEEETKNLFKGFGQLTILSYLSAGLKKMGDTAAEMATKLRLGEVATEDLIIKVAEGIPIIGKFVEAGRGIREAITGEQAYTDVLKQQTEQQEKRLATVKTWLDAMKEARRLSEDLARQLSGKPGALFDIASIFLGGERGAEDLQDKLKEQFKKAFDVIAEQRKELGDKISKLQAQPGGVPISFTQEGGRQVTLDADAAIKQQIDATTGILKKFDDQAAALRGKIEDIEKQSRDKLGRGVATGVMRIFGEEAVKAFDAAKGAMDKYIANLPRMSEETASALEKTRTDWDKFQTLIIRFRTDLQQGLITPKEFENLSGGALFDTAKRSLESFFGQAKARFETLGIIIDSNLGSPLDFVKRAIAGTANLFTSLANPKGNAPAITAPDLRTASLSLAGLGDKIQQGVFNEPVNIARQQLAEQKNAGKRGGASLEELKKMNDTLNKKLPPSRAVK